MIASLNGKITLIKDNYLILDVNGLGYKVFVGSVVVELREKENIFLYTHLAVRENSLELFGFNNFTKLQLFELLISISGIGPKAGISILDITTPESLKRAVISGNTEELTKVSGIGKKIAGKIILELQNKIEKIETLKSENYDIEVYETLERLGFNRNLIRQTLTQLQSKTTDEKIKEALKLLGQAR